MAEITLIRIRRIQLLLLAAVIVMLFFGGCGGEKSDDVAGLDDMAVSLSGGAETDAIGTGGREEPQNTGGAEYPGETEGSGEAGNPGGTEDPGESGDPGGTEGSGQTGNPGGSGNVRELELNTNASTVTYQGTAFMSSYRTIGGDSIYNTGFLGEFDGDHPAEGPYFAGRIGLEEDVIQQFPLEIPEDMFAYRGCIDSQGRWHLMVLQKSDEAVTNKKTEIWVINRNGDLEQSFDITNCMKESVMLPDWIEVDNDGNYYLASAKTILVIDVVNQSVEPLHFSGEIIGFGRGRSGALYGVFDVEGNDILGVVDPHSGSIEKCAVLPENGIRPKFSTLQAGVATELLLANKGDGIWSYDGTELKQEMTLEDTVANGQDILAMGFMWDGRVCIMSYENGKYVFHYEPIQ